MKKGERKLSSASTFAYYIRINLWKIHRAFDDWNEKRRRYYKRLAHEFQMKVIANTVHLFINYFLIFSHEVKRNPHCVIFAMKWSIKSSSFSKLFAVRRKIAADTNESSKKGKNRKSLLCVWVCRADPTERITEQEKGLYYLFTNE